MVLATHPNPRKAPKNLTPRLMLGWSNPAPLSTPKFYPGCPRAHCATNSKSRNPSRKTALPRRKAESDFFDSSLAKLPFCSCSLALTTTECGQLRAAMLSTRPQ